MTNSDQITHCQLSPTAYEVATAKQAGQTVAKRRQEGKRELKKVLGQYMPNHAPESNYKTLVLARDIATEYGLEYPLWAKWFLRLHEVARATE